MEAVLEVENAELKTHVADQAKEVAAKSEEIQQLLSEWKEGAEQIRSYIWYPGDVLNKARVF